MIRPPRLVVSLVIIVGLTSSLACAMSAQQVPIADVISSTPNSFVTRVVVVPRGARAQLVQLDPLRVHNVVALDVGKRGPLFHSPTLDFGHTGEIAGVSRLPAGDYPFSCSVHEEMYGVLLVR